MAQAPVLYDFDIALSHVDRNLDVPLSMKVARHPSETLERLWLRVLAYCWLYEERLAFGPGLSDPDSPDLELKDYTGQTTLWVRVGKADPVKVQRAVDQNSSARVAVIFGAAARMDSFIADAREVGALRVARAELAAIDAGVIDALARVESRRTKLSLTIVGDHLYVDRGGTTFDGAITRGSAA
jgi:uncharacterized protein YaeQ